MLPLPSAVSAVYVRKATSSNSSIGGSGRRYDPFGFYATFDYDDH
jgi:hypothetical protein